MHYFPDEYDHILWARNGVFMVAPVRCRDVARGKKMMTCASHVMPKSAVPAKHSDVPLSQLLSSTSSKFLVYSSLSLTAQTSHGALQQKQETEQIRREWRL